MGDTSLFTPKTRGIIGLQTNSTDTAVSDPTALGTSKPLTVDDATTPTSNKAVFPCSYNHTLLHFFGGDAANEQFQAKIYLWRSAWKQPNKRADDESMMWIPMEAILLDVTLGALAGVAANVIDNTNFIADTVVANGTYSTRFVPDIRSPADDSAAHVLIDTHGFHYMEVQFDIDALATNSAGANVIAYQL